MKQKSKGIAGATLAGIKGGLTPSTTYNESNMQVSSKRCLITGANSGLGKGIAIRLASLGAQITMAGRTMDESAREQILSASNCPTLPTTVLAEQLDLASFQSVLDFCSRAQANHQTFDIIVLNAAMVAKESSTTLDGLDTMTQVNFLSNVLLIETLLKQKSISNHARIIVVSSEAHRWSESINLDTIGTPRSFKMKESLKVYSDTKFMMATYAAHLAQRLRAETEPNIAVHALCPGAVNSNLAREAPSYLQPLLKTIFFLFFASPKKASRPAVHLACSPSLEGKTGLYYHLMNEKHFDERATESTFQKQLLAHATQRINDKYGQLIV